MIEKLCQAVSPHGTKCSLPLHIGTHYSNVDFCMWQDNRHLHDNNCAGNVDQCEYEYASGWRCHNAATDEEYCPAHADDETVEDWHGKATGT